MYINWYEIHRRWILYKSIKPLLHNLRNLRVKSYALPRNLKSLVITVIHDNLFSVFLDPTSDLLHNPFCFLHTPFLFSSYAFSVSSQSFSAFFIILSAFFILLFCFFTILFCFLESSFNLQIPLQILIHIPLMLSLPLFFYTSYRILFNYRFLLAFTSRKAPCYNGLKWKTIYT